MEVRHLDGNAGNSAVTNLEYGTHSDNMQDMMRHHRGQVAKTHCPYDHEYTEENTRLYPRGIASARHANVTGAVSGGAAIRTTLHDQGMRQAGQGAKGLCPRWATAGVSQARKRAQNALNMTVENSES